MSNSPSSPQVQVDGPDSVAKTSVEEESPGRYLVTYTPREVGLFDVRVLWNGREVPGSPFHPKIVDPRKVCARRGVWCRDCSFNCVLYGHE